MDLADEYFESLRTADLDRLMHLFAADAEVHSPLYGVLAPADLFGRVFAETAQTVPSLRRVLTDGTAAIAFWFDYSWTLSGGAAATVNAVDVAELNADGLIERLYIIYDTRSLGQAFTEQATGSGGDER